MQCPICHQSKKITLEDRSLRVYHCLLCTHRFTETFEEEQEEYDEAYFKESHKNWFANPDHAFFAFIHERLLQEHKKQMRLFDIGCGTGDLLRFIRDHDTNMELVGIDLIANDYPGIRFLRGDVYRYPFDETFDAIVCLHTIEHVPDPQRFVEIMDRLLTPGGLLLIATIDSSSLIHELARVLRTFGLRAAYNRIFSRHHLQHFSFRSLRCLLEKHSFDVLEHFNYNHPLKAVDVPGCGIVRFVHRIAVWGIFSGMRIRGKGMLQTIICRKPLSLQ